MFYNQYFLRKTNEKGLKTLSFNDKDKIKAWAPTTSRARLRRSTILSALGPDHALTILFLGTHEQLPSGSPIIEVLSRATHLTSEFQRNPKPVSFQKALC
ncbi:hypothetical protein DVH24_014228 [Malus domestica]|uniref:Uncharacterized protein n=1 Tax=Malus domestica TaxID=3750 RepID=A0A498JIX4_MALDO|nr:hypothetical protein DVH24_014228 [Malus domestica]